MLSKFTGWVYYVRPTLNCRWKSILRAGKSLKILVADDNEVNLKVMIGMLEFAGHEVDSAENGEAVMLALEREQYQLLILDCMMPKFDGFQVTRKIRAGDSSLCDPDIPILAVTALAAEQDRMRCLEAGMTGFCSKPVKAKALFAWIARQFDFQGLPEKKGLPSIDAPARWSSKRDDPEQPGYNQRKWGGSISSMLIRDATAWQVQLPELLAISNHDGLALLAHKIKGSADVLGFQELSAVAAELENSGKAGMNSKTSKQVAQVVTALRQVIEEVQGQS